MAVRDRDSVDVVLTDLRHRFRSQLLTEYIQVTAKFERFENMHFGSMVSELLPHTPSCSALDPHSPDPHNNHDQRRRVFSTGNFEEVVRRRIEKSNAVHKLDRQLMHKVAIILHLRRHNAHERSQ